MEKFDCNRLLKEYALSCIENYLLYLISQKKYQWKTIYCKSFMPFKNILKELYGGIGYSHFKGVKRLQDIAMEQGFSTLEYLDNVDNLSDIENEYYAIQVTNKYMCEKYNYKPWRRDHYILLHNKMNCSVVEYLNDVPMDSGQMLFEDANKICDGVVILFNVKDNVNVDLDRAINNARLCIDKFGFNDTQIEWNNLTFEIARDAVSISKVLVKRQIEFIKLFDNKFDEVNYYGYLTSIQTKLEYMRLKKIDISRCNDIMKEVLIYDDKYYKKVTEILNRNVPNVLI